MYFYIFQSKNQVSHWTIVILMVSHCHLLVTISLWLYVSHQSVSKYLDLSLISNWYCSPIQTFTHCHLPVTVCPSQVTGDVYFFILTVCTSLCVFMSFNKSSQSHWTFIIENVSHCHLSVTIYVSLFMSTVIQ